MNALLSRFILMGVPEHHNGNTVYDLSDYPEHPMMFLHSQLNQVSEIVCLQDIGNIVTQHLHIPSQHKVFNLFLPNVREPLHITCDVITQSTDENINRVSLISPDGEVHFITLYIDETQPVEVFRAIRCQDTLIIQLISEGFEDLRGKGENLLVTVKKGKTQIFPLQMDDREYQTLEHARKRDGKLEVFLANTPFKAASDHEVKILHHFAIDEHRHALLHLTTVPDLSVQDEIRRIPQRADGVFKYYLVGNNKIRIWEVARYREWLFCDVLIGTPHYNIETGLIIHKDWEMDDFVNESEPTLMYLIGANILGGGFFFFGVGEE